MPHKNNFLIFVFLNDSYVSAIYTNRTETSEKQTNNIDHGKRAFSLSRVFVLNVSTLFVLVSCFIITIRAYNVPVYTTM